MLVGLGGALWALGLEACLYEPDQRCGPRQHLGALGSCLCDDDFVLQGHDCVPCGEKELWQNGVCACEPGYARAENGGVCQEAGAGLACDPGADPGSCIDADYSVCRSPGGDVGYCTKECGDDGDCPRGFVCDTEANPATCMTSAVGQGDPCDGDADCVDKDATYCEVLQGHACLVQGCSTSDPLSCSEGWSCCDLESLGLAKTLCVPEGMCPTAG